MSAALVAGAIAFALGAAQAGASQRVGATCFGQPATIVGTDGDDTLRGTPANDVIVAGEGSDIVLAGAGDDLICGEGGDDFIFGQDGNDQIDAGTGNDAVGPGAGDDTIVGGDGELDLLAFLDATGPVTASLVTGTATGQGNDTFSGFEGIAGGPFDDVLTGDAADFNALIGAGGNDTMDGGPGFDGIIFSSGPVTASLAEGTTSGADGNDTLRNDEGLEGTSGDDNFTGDDGTNVLDGRDGSDILNGLGGSDLLQGDAQNDTAPGNDTLNGGAGDDFLQPSPGNDVLDGGPGTRDLVDFAQMPGGVVGNLGAHTASGPGVGTPRIVNVEGFYGSSFADTLIGDGGPNLLLGQDGVDKLAGAAGDDFLDGGAGADSFDGGPGIDYCLDGRGKGCEFSGVPSGSTAPAAADAAMTDLARTVTTLRTLVRPVHLQPLRASASGQNAELGDASCTGVTPPRPVASLDVSKRRASAAPPHKAPAQKGQKPESLRSAVTPAWLGLSPWPDSAQASLGDLTWQGTLYRYDAKKRVWRPYKKTAVAYGSVDPSGAAIWTDSAGRPISTTSITLPAGRFAWKATLTVPDQPAVTDWIEPHTNLSGKGGLYLPLCSFS